MKRFTILLLSLMTLGMYAQDPNPISIRTDFDVVYGDGYPKGETVIWASDHDTRKTATYFWGDGNTHEVVPNPAQGGINPRTNCLKVTCTNADGSIGINLDNLFGSYGINLNGRRRISMLFKAGENNITHEPMGNCYYTQMQLETEYSSEYGSDGRQYYMLGAYYDATEDKSTDARHDGWKRLYFDFTPYNTLDNSWNNGYHTKVIGDYPDKLMFKPKICKVTIASDNRTIESHESHTCSDGDVYYIDDIKIEDVPYAEGYWINDDTNLPKGRKIWHDAEQYNEWNTEYCALPKSGSNGVLHLSGTWLKGQNIVNPEIWEKEVVAGRNPWVYEFNEYRDLSWHVKPDKVKLMVFHKDAKLRWPDRGGLLGTNTGTPEATQGYPARFIDNLNVLIFAEKSCILPDEGDNLDAHWHDTNAVIHYKAGDIHYGTATGDIWEASELELTEDYGFVNPLQFTALNLIKVHRSMKAGFNALIYPFELTPEELKCARVGTVYHHRDPGTGGLLYFVPAPKTEPNVPYLTEYLASSDDATSKVAYDYQEFRNDNHIVYPVQEDYRYSNNASKGTLFGNYQKDFSGVGKWGLVTTETWQGFMLGEGDAKFKPFRGYLDELPAADVSGARMLSIFDADDTDVTGIETPGLPFKAETLKTIYDMQGRVIKCSSIATLSKGIYIINGKKTIIK